MTARVYSVHMADGRVLTMIDMEGRGVENALASARDRFGADNVLSVTAA